MPRPLLALAPALASFALALGLSGCGSSPLPPARHVRSADVASLGPTAFERPLVIEFEAGDVIPLYFKLDGPFMKSPEDAPPIPLRATRHFFLRIDKNGLKSSPDGKNFDGKSAVPGSFSAGVGVTKEGIRAHISIRTPTPAGLESAPSP